MKKKPNPGKNAEPQYFTSILEMRKRQSAILHETNEFVKYTLFEAN